MTYHTTEETEQPKNKWEIDSEHNPQNAQEISFAGMTPLLAKASLQGILPNIIFQVKDETLDGTKLFQINLEKSSGDALIAAAYAEATE